MIFLNQVHDAELETQIHLSTLSGVVHKYLAQAKAQRQIVAP